MQLHSSEQTLIDIFSGLLDGSISREEAHLHLPKQRAPRTHNDHLAYWSFDEASNVIGGASVSEAGDSCGEPYFYRMEDFAEWRAIISRKDGTATNTAGMKHLRYHQWRLLHGGPVAMFKMGIDEIANRLGLPHIRGIDQLDYTKTLALLTIDNRQYVLIEHTRAPIRPAFELYIEESVEDELVEIQHAMQSMSIDISELFWRTYYFQEQKKEQALYKQRKESQQ